MRFDLARLLARPIAHRGLHDRTRGVIENSLAAADAAAVAGFGIECDIQCAGDGEAVVFHDETLERLTAGSGRIDACSSESLAAIKLTGSDDGIATLPTFLAHLDGRVPLVIEIKSRFDGDLRLADRAIGALSDYRGIVALKSFDASLMARCRHLGARCPLGLVGPAENDLASGNTRDDDYDFLSWAIGDLATLRAKNPLMPLMSWTIRSPKDQALAKQHDAQIVFEQFRPC